MEKLKEKLQLFLEKIKNIDLGKLLPKFMRGGGDLYGIDLGSKSIKILRLGGRPGSWSVEKWASLPFPDTAEGASLIEKSPEAIQLLKDFLSQAGKKVLSAATSLSGNAVVVRYVKLPKASPEQLAKSLPQEAESFIPFPIAEVNLAFEILGQISEEGQEKIEIVLVAAKKEPEAQQLNILKSVGLTPTIVDIDAFCLQRVVPPSTETESNDVVLILNIGANLTTISLIEKGICKVARDVFIAGNAIDKALQKNLNVPPQAAEKAKMSVSLSDSPDSESAKTTIATLKGLVLEIQRSMDFYLSQKTEHQINKIFVAGGCAQIPGLCAFLSSELRLPVEILDPFVGVKGADKIPAEARPQFAVAAGLAMRAGESA